MPMKPLALFASIAFLVGCSACAAGGKTPVTTNHFYEEGAQALTKGDRSATKGCNTGAIKYYFTAVELFTLADAPEALATCYNNIGTLYTGEGKRADALAYYREAQAIHTRMNNLQGNIRVLTNIATAYLADGTPDKAEASLNQADTLATEGQITWPQSTITRASLMLHRGDATGALALLLDLKTTIGAPEASLAASLHFTLGRSFFALTHHEEALAEFSKALDVDRKRGALHLMATDLREMGRCLAAMDRKDEAIWHLERALRITTLLGATGEQKVLQELVIELTGNTEAAPLSVSGYFIERWTHGDSFAAPCD
ncbi:tetratricopeptide repeat protein [Desulfoluna sp.]|uniref:tetratricopeptide repeat protein n=1 Tax=Desulfoluna sp. TaxID=2045199 RepID=UPI002602ED82|nr:tetratricopeptide repeat protein [Desulfoluna sp.]